MNPLLPFYCDSSQQLASVSHHPSHQEVELCSQCAGRSWAFPIPPPFKLGSTCNLLQTKGGRVGSAVLRVIKLQTIAQGESQISKGD
ncbi:hypothetical protein Q5P01_007093 [Channa striata]|uniref:Uncharacterized protein n=1 Tax=Channa striata TaxID=64152 RepID=A0AA88N8P5_CHASR|nr:hypothetical protein Q5P01_007093 [Channa striata]